MKLKALTLSLLLGLAATSVIAEDRYLVRVPANVNLSAATPETPQDPISLSLSAEALPAGMVGAPYEFNLLDRLSITGGTGAHNYSDTNWSLKAGDALPPGLAIEGDKIVGTPTVKNEAGASFELTGTYQDASGKQVYTIVVNFVPLQVTHFAVGFNHSCAVTPSGSVKCWGWNGYKQLGDDTHVNKNTPVDVLGLDEKIVSISLGAYHSCALSESGNVKCWGFNDKGQIGNGEFANSYVPATKVMGLDEPVSAITSGLEHNCALMRSGKVKCWGENDNGQLGDGTREDRSKPVDTYPETLPSLINEISAGSNHTCALDHSANVFCWGKGTDGQLGNPGAGLVDRVTPTNVWISNATNISSGGVHSCAVTQSGEIKCWGSNTWGQIGDNGSANPSASPRSVILFGATAKKVFSGTHHTCATTSTNGLKCWGSNRYGELGASISDQARLWPIAVTDLSTGVLDVSIRGNHACASIENGTLKCWGYNYFGQVGDGTNENRSAPVDVLP